MAGSEPASIRPPGQGQTESESTADMTTDRHHRRSTRNRTHDGTTACFERCNTVAGRHKSARAGRGDQNIDGKQKRPAHKNHSRRQGQQSRRWMDSQDGRRPWQTRRCSKHRGCLPQQCPAGRRDRRGLQLPHGRQFYGPFSLSESTASSLVKGWQYCKSALIYCVGGQVETQCHCL